MTWREVKIGEVAAVYDGPHATPKTTDEGPIFLGIDALRNGRLVLGDTRHVSEEDFATWTRRVQPKAGDLVFSYETRLGEAALIPDGLRCCLGRRLGLLRPRAEALDSHFLLYSYLSPAFQAFLASRTIHGATVDRLPLKQFASFPLSLPDLAQQKQMVAPLRSLDDKIELNHRMNETLEAMAQAIFRDWFVDFGPVRRKMDGATDPVAIMGGLTPDPTRAAQLAALFPAALGENRLPLGWDEEPLSEQLDIIGGGTPKTTNANYWGGPIPWFSVADTPAGRDVFVFDTEKSITERGLAESSARLIATGTTIISARGTVGNLAVAASPMAFNQSCYALRSSRGEHPAFVYLCAARAVEQLRAMAHGSVFSTITRQTFDALSFASPPIEVLTAFETQVSPLFGRIRSAVAENRTLAETRDYLLPRLMSGQVRIGDSKAMVA